MKYAIALLLSSASAYKGKCPFGHGSSASSATLMQVASNVEQIQATYPSEILTCSGDKVATTESLTVAQYQGIVSRVIQLFDTQQNLSQTAMAGCLIRFSGHDFMDYRVGNNHGADGCMNFNDGDNAGLSNCVQQSGLAEVYDAVCGVVSLADFIVIAGEAVTIRTAADYDANNKFGDGTLGQQFQNAFAFGRTTKETCEDNLHLLPNPENGCGGLDEIFVQNIYAAAGNDAWRFTAAINGAHTVGAAHVENSGYSGFWSDRTNQGIFNNDYYKSLLNKGWQPKTAINGNTAKNQWELSDDHHAQTDQLMLDTDLCMVYGHNSGTLNSRSANCCAWLRPRTVFNAGAVENGENYCGRTYDAAVGALDTRQSTGLCCGKMGTQRPLADCDDLNRPVGPAYNDVVDFAANEDEWLETYVAAWKMAQENGWTTLKALTTAEGAPANNGGDAPTDTGDERPPRRSEREESGDAKQEERKSDRGGKKGRGGRR